ncbi:hypothetical protein IB61_00940 [Brucella abortus LMN2]|nr:hypothetical protein IB61_00940 [Brucella abortus LMN2]
MRPFGAITDAPFSSAWLASGISAVTTTAPGRECSAIQSSAASRLPETTTRSTRCASRGIAMKLLATITTGRLCRSATR